MKLSSLISNGMVIQRNKPLTISGEATANEKIEVTFLNKTYTTVAAENGKWSVTLDPAEAGGPHQLKIVGTEEIHIDDILVGDVWVLGGQSNMELPVNRTLDLFAEEMKAVNNPEIRHFSVPQVYNFHQPKEMLAGGEWKKATPEDVLNFSAIGYFFAAEIYRKHRVPIGLIATAVGGTPIEAWMREETLREVGGYDEILDQSKDDQYIKDTIEMEEKREQDWHQNLNQQDQGMVEKWYHPDTDTSTWESFDVPNSWADTELEPIRGAVWYQKTFNLPEDFKDQETTLSLGTLIDADHTYLNGELVGHTGYKYPPRRYPVPKGILKPGKNTVTVRLVSTESTGGFVKDMPYELITSEGHIPLTGTWKYKVGAITEGLKPKTFFQYFPRGLYNEMIAPISDFPMTGVLWYQGESNIARPDGYHKLFERMVQDWRDTWQIGDFPFLFVQLANLETGEDDNESYWAKLRNEQLKSLQVKNTAMAVSFDVGEANDLHPQDKKTVGERLAKCANVLAYGKNIEYMGPLYQSHQVVGNEIEITFNHVGAGLTVKGDQLNGFVISGQDNIFKPAQAEIRDNKVIVKHPEITNPKHVRYGWSDNPENANLYNKDNLPASPFTTE